MKELSKKVPEFFVLDDTKKAKGKLEKSKEKSFQKRRGRSHKARKTKPSKIKKHNKLKIEIPPTLVKPILQPKRAKPPRPPRKAKASRRFKSRKLKAAKQKLKSKAAQAKYKAKAAKAKYKAKAAKRKSYKSKAARYRASKHKAFKPKSRASKHKLCRKKLRYSKFKRRKRCCPRSYSSCSGCPYRSCRSKYLRRKTLRRRRRNAKLGVLPKIDRPPITIKPPSKIKTSTPGIVIPPIPSPGSSFVSKRSVTAKCRTKKSKRGKKRTKCKTVIPSCY